MINVAFKGDETIIKSDQHVYQWDTGQKIMVSGLGDSNINQVHFSFNGLKTAYPVNVTNSSGTVTVNIPNIVLRYGKDVYMYLCIKNTNGTVVTIKTVIIPVIKRNMPENYMYDDNETVAVKLDELQTEIQRSTAVDTEHENRFVTLENDITLLNDNTANKYTVVANASFSGDTGGLTDGSSSNRIRTDNIPVKKGDTVCIKNGTLKHALGIWKGSISRSNIVRNDGAWVLSDETINIENDGYICIAFSNSNSTAISLSQFDGDVVIYRKVAFSYEVEEVNNAINPNSVDLELSWKGGYLSSDSGAFNSSTSGTYYTTDLIPIHSVSKIITNCINDYKCKLFVYDSNKKALRSEYNYYYDEHSWDAKNAVYCRIGITTKNEDIIDVDTINDNITINTYSYIADLCDKTNTPDYFSNSYDLRVKINIDDKVSEYCSLYKDISGLSESFVFFSDAHVFNSQNSPNCDKLMTTIQKAVHSIGANFVLNGGDMLQNNDTQDLACKKLADFKGKSDFYFKKCYHALGNHDTNYQGVNDSGTANTGILSNTALTAIMFPEYKNNYYSFNGINTKFWVLDSGTDWNNDVDEYRKTQLVWLANDLKNDNSENKAIVTHIYFNEGAEHTFGLEIRKIIIAYNTRGTYEIGDTSIDFSSVSGKIRFVLCGHTHVDMESEVASTPIICIKKALAGGTYAFDAILVNYAENIINCIRFGDGENRKYSLETGKKIN